MKRYLSFMLAALLLVSCLLIGAPSASAAKKATESRAIAIVFDNSGSMYYDGEKAWCRATYAMEVFASMLNQGDVLQIYPMWDITVAGQKYSMDNPFQITDVTQATSIREIYTDKAGGTPIETIDFAASGLKKVNADKKYLIVLTDGDTFHQNGIALSESATAKALDEKVKQYAGNGMAMMFLGIGTKACMPTVAQSSSFVKAKASDSAQVLSTLTMMCNQIFGRDTLPKERISGNSVEFDISMSKLIVFVQGTDISGLKLSGGSIGSPVNSQQTKYSTLGAGGRSNDVDTSLQGMIVTYEGVASGTYTIEHTGKADSIEVYYEPDADLAFVFTDAEGNQVDPNALYEGDYKVSFGMVDAKTGQLIQSDLLGKPTYQGSYFINGQEVPISADGFSGSVDIPLKMGDTFEANLTVTYLSGYTISKDSSDFGWPEGGIQVAAKPAGDLKIDVSGGEELYSLQELEKGAPYIVKVSYQGELLTGQALKDALSWNEDASNAKIASEFAEDHCKLYLKYRNPDAPQETVCGECTLQLTATYAAQGTAEAKASKALTYNIKDDFSPLQLKLEVPQDYIVIKDMAQAKPMTVKMTMNGAMLTAEEFAAVQLHVDCGGIEYTLTPNEADSSYTIKLKATEGIKQGDYTIKVTGTFTDKIGRETKTGAESMVTLSTMPLWLKWAIGLLLLLLLFLLIWWITHIRVMPKHAHITKRDSKMTVDGEDVTKNASFVAKIDGGKLAVYSKYGGSKTGFSLDVKKGKESYLYKKAVKKSAEVRGDKLSKTGTPTIQSISVGSIKYVLNADTGKFERKPKSDKPYLLRHGTNITYSGTMLQAGIPKSFTVNTKLNFKKK